MALCVVCKSPCFPLPFCSEHIERFEALEKSMAEGSLLPKTYQRLRPLCDDIEWTNILLELIAFQAKGPSDSGEQR